MTVRWRRKRGLAGIAGVLAAAWILAALPCCAEASDGHHTCPHASGGSGPVRPGLPVAERGDPPPHPRSAADCCHDHKREAPQSGSCCDTIGACCSKPLGDKSSVNVHSVPLLPTLTGPPCPSGEAPPAARQRSTFSRHDPPIYLRHCSLLR